MSPHKDPQIVFASLAILEIPVDLWNHHMGGDFEAAKAGLPIIKDMAKSNYRRLAKEHHPDRGGDAEKFRQIQAAWECVRELEAIEPNPVEVIRFSFEQSFGIKIFTSANNTTTATFTTTGW